MAILSIEAARNFAIVAHGKQVYASQFPYLTHLEGVVAILGEFGYTDDVMVASAYLHDTIEDTNVNYQDIKSNFGEEVAEIVYDVTDELGRNRKERHEKTYPKTAKNPKAVILKLADRIANVTFSVRSGEDKLRMYKKEHESFRAILFDGQNLDMWERLDALMGEK